MKLHRHYLPKLILFISLWFHSFITICDEDCDSRKPAVEVWRFVPQGAAAGSTVNFLFFFLERQEILQQTRSVSRNRHPLRGLFTGLAAHGSYCAMQIPIFHFLRNELDPDGNNVKGLVFSGAVAGALPRVVLAPPDFFRTRLIANDGKMTRTELARYLFDHGGFKGFFQGIVPSLWASGIFAGIALPSQLVWRRTFAEESDIPLPVGRVLADGISGVSAKFGVMPFDNCRRLQQMGDQPVNLLKVAQDVFKNEGVGGFYCGWKWSLSRQFFASAVFFQALDAWGLVLGPVEHEDDLDD